MKTYILFLSCFILIKNVLGARILAAALVPSYSHAITFKNIWKELALRGHEVVLLTSNPPNLNLKNVIEVDLSYYHHLYKVNVAEYYSSNIWLYFLKLYEERNELICKQVKNSYVKNLLTNKNETFDLVIAELFTYSLLGLKHKYNCPLIAIYSMDNPFFHKLVGNPIHSSLYPHGFKAVNLPLTFWDRWKSFLDAIVIWAMRDLIFNKLDNNVMRRIFGENVPSVEELQKDVDMVFVASNPVVYGIKPTVPAWVSIGVGIHLEKEKPLHQDLKDYLDKSKNGVIYFSLGSYLKCKDLDMKTRSILMETFAELPYDIIMKFENEELEGKSKNVLIRKWLPQQDLLRHSKIKLFITQGGLQSIEESIYSHVPIVGIPFVGDQKYNIKNIEHRGMGIYVDYKTMSKDSLKEAILEVINNPMFKENTKKLAELTLDQPMSGLEKAIWWSEYVIRHKGAKHLKGPAVDMPYYQYFLLDVIGFSLGILVVIIYFFMRITKLIFSIFWRKTLKKEKEH